MKKRQKKPEGLAVGRRLRRSRKCLCHPVAEAAPRTFPEAILILGPTGAGKTPLGDYLERHGLEGRRCHHFDFGDRMRRIENGRLAVKALTADDRAAIRRVLRDGKLLQGRQFHIAAAILEDFIRRRKVADDDIVILNGLPRHAGQADKIGTVVRVSRVVALQCSADVAWARIKLNAGGDRMGRGDDSRPDVVRKFKLYRQATKPLERYYRRRAVPVIAIPVATATTSGDVVGGIL